MRIGQGALTQEQFLEKAKTAHPESNYDYTKVEYINNRSLITIICPTHGDFVQEARQHLRGHGCKQCAIELRGKDRTTTPEEFISRAAKVHEGKYSYKSTVYTLASEKVVITCPEHGNFEQMAGEHLRGRGCFSCGRELHRIATTETTDTFITKANKVHKGHYSYDKTVYKHSTQRISVTCPTHGYFSQVANEHLRGSGCPKCARAYTTSQTTLTNEEFCTRAVEVHKGKYDYSRVVYTGALKNVNIICPEHGEFSQIASVHLRGSQCPSCPNVKTRTNAANFIKESQKTHGDKYGYSKVVYLAAKKKVTIECPIHGEFQKTPSKHLGGQGCPRCKESNGERETSRALEALNLTYITQYRIPECKSKYPLPFDFGVFDGENNLWFLVEFQGAQHFIPVRFSVNWSKEDMANALVERQGTDAIKKTYCASNGIPLLEISYKDKRKVVEIVKEFVAKLVGIPTFIRGDNGFNQGTTHNIAVIELTNSNSRNLS